jgi:hypothetical protein
MEHALSIICHTGDTPRRDNLDVRLEAVEGELKADLVVALAGAAVGDKAKDEDLGVRKGFICSDSTGTHSQPSRSATAIMPRAMTGRAREVPRR